MTHIHRDDRKEISGGRLLFTIILNFTITAAQVVGGLLANSLALLSDALHNLSDGIAIVIAYGAYKWGKKGANESKTFGYKRAEILAALLNSAVLVGISVYLFVEAYHRILNPEEVDGALMIIVASIGLIANLISVLILKRDSTSNLNVKAAYLHLLGDTLSSVAVVIGAALIIFYDLYWLDPILTVIIGLYILKETIGIMKEAADILMQSAPAEFQLRKVKKDIESLPEVANIHHVHVWQLSETDVHFECHADLNENLDIESAGKIRQKIEEYLHKEHGISHVTIQFEYGECHDKKTIFNGGK